MGSDGLFDNLFEDEIRHTIEKVIDSKKSISHIDLAQKIANHLLKECKDKIANPVCSTPFGQKV